MVARNKQVAKIAEKKFFKQEKLPKNAKKI